MADVSSDGILRLDLDLNDAVLPNGTHGATTNGTETSKEAQPDAGKISEKSLEPVVEEDAQTEPEVTTQKKAIKPPMPPTKEAKSKPAPVDEPDTDDSSEKKVCVLCNCAEVFVEVFLLIIFFFLCPEATDASIKRSQTLWTTC